jgi:hypothetical protein
LTIDVKRHIFGGVIKSFHDSDTEALYNRKQCRRFQSFAKVGFKRLLTLDAARTLGDLAAVQDIGSKSSAATAKVSTASVSMTSGESASSGTEMPKM